MEAARQAVRSARSVTYAYDFQGGGGLSKAPRVIGTARLERGTELATAHLRVHTELHPPKGVESSVEVRELEVASDGVEVTAVSVQQELYYRGAVADGAWETVKNFGGNGLILPFVDPDPYRRELDGARLSLEGSLEVEGQGCEQVRVRNPGDPTEVIWCFGTEDHLPYRMDVVYTNVGEDTRTVVEIRDVVVNAELDPSIFRLARPDGYALRSLAMHVALGAQAPALSWEDATGARQDLDDLRGGGVVLAFVSTLDGGSKKALQVLQRVHEASEGRPYRVMAAVLPEMEQGDHRPRLEELGVTFPVIVASEEAIEAWHVVMPGVTYVLDARGVVVMYELSGRELSGRGIGDALRSALGG